MKLSAKAISSPARTDKFPPPLMRFLRSNAGSRSRRSRSSPMFVLRKKNNNNAIETTQEPSSPKVTCMGQVRAKRSSKQSSSTVKRDRPPTPTPTRCCRCWWIRKPNPCRCRPVWPKWAFFRRKPTKLKEDSVKSESNFHRDEEERVSVSVDDDDNAFAFAFASNTPPKNALLLTRCRSAPYRSSSLASRFWSSPLRSEENETQSTSIDNDKSSSNSQRESVSDQEDSVGERFASSIANSEKVETLLKGESEARPVVLTRCRSEPARTGHRLDPEVNSSWKKRRLGFADTSYPLHMLSD